MPYLKTLRKTADEPFQPGLPEEEEVAAEEVAPSVGADAAPATTADKALGVPAVSAPAPAPLRDYRREQRDFEAAIPEPELPRVYKNMEALDPQKLLDDAARQGASEPLKALREYRKEIEAQAEAEEPPTMLQQVGSGLLDAIGGTLSQTLGSVPKAAKDVASGVYNFISTEEAPPVISDYLLQGLTSADTVSSRAFKEKLQAPVVDFETVDAEVLNQPTGDGRKYRDVLAERKKVRTYSDVVVDVFSSALKQKYTDEAGGNRKKGGEEYRRDLGEIAQRLKSEDRPNPSVRDAETHLAFEYSKRMTGDKATDLLLAAALTAGTKALKKTAPGWSDLTGVPLVGAAARDAFQKVMRDSKEIQKTAPQEALAELIAQQAYSPDALAVNFSDARPPKPTSVQRAAADVDPELRASNEMLTMMTGVPAAITAGIRGAEGDQPRALAFNLDEAFSGVSGQKFSDINAALAAAGIAPFRRGQNRSFHNTAASGYTRGNATEVINVVRSVDPVAALRGTAFGRFQVLGLEGSGDALKLAKENFPDATDEEAAAAFFSAFERQPEAVGNLLYVRWWKNHPQAVALVQSPDFKAEDLAGTYYGSKFKVDTEGNFEIDPETGKKKPAPWIENFDETYKAYRGPEPEPEPEPETTAEEAIEALAATLPPSRFAEAEDEARFGDTIPGRIMRGRVVSAIGQYIAAGMSGGPEGILEAAGLIESDTRKREKLFEESQDRLTMTQVPQRAFDFQTFAESEYAPVPNTAAFLVSVQSAQTLREENPELYEIVIESQSLGIGQGFQKVVDEFLARRLNELKRADELPKTREETAKVEVEAFAAALDVVTAFQVQGIWTTPIIVDMRKLDKLGKEYEPPGLIRSWFRAGAPKIEVVGRFGDEIIFRQEGGAMAALNILDAAPIIGQAFNIGFVETGIELFTGEPRRFEDEATAHHDAFAAADVGHGFMEMLRGGIRGVSTQANLAEVGLRMSAYGADWAVSTDFAEEVLKTALEKDFISAPEGLSGEQALLASKDLVRGFATIPGLLGGMAFAIIHPDLLGGGVSAIRGVRAGVRQFRLLPKGLRTFDAFSPRLGLKLDPRAETLTQAGARVKATKQLQELAEEGVAAQDTAAKAALALDALHKIQKGDPGDADDVSLAFAEALEELRKQDKYDAARRKKSDVVGRQVDTEAGTELSVTANQFVVGTTDDVLDEAAARQSVGAAAALDANLSVLVNQAINIAIDRGKKGTDEAKKLADELEALLGELKLGDAITLSPGRADQVQKESQEAAEIFDSARRVEVLLRAITLLGDADETPGVLKDIIRTRLGTAKTSIGKLSYDELGLENLPLVALEDNKVLPNSALQMFGPVDEAEFATQTKGLRDKVATLQKKVADPKATDAQRQTAQKALDKVQARLTNSEDAYGRVRGFHNKVIEAFEDGTIFDPAVREALKQQATEAELILETPTVLFRNAGTTGRGRRYQTALIEALDLVDAVRDARTPRQVLTRGLGAVLATSAARGTALQRIALDMVDVGDLGKGLSQAELNDLKVGFLTSGKINASTRWKQSLMTGLSEGLYNLLNETPFVGSRLAQRITPETAARYADQRTYASVQNGLSRLMSSDGNSTASYAYRLQVSVVRRLEERIKSITEGAGDETPEALAELQAALADWSRAEKRAEVVLAVTNIVKAGKTSPIETLETLKLPIAIDVESLGANQSQYVVSNATQKFLQDSDFLKAYGYAGEEERRAAKLSGKKKTVKRRLRKRSEVVALETVLDQMARFAAGVNAEDTPDVADAKIGQFFEGVRQVRRIGGGKVLADGVKKQRELFDTTIRQRIEELTGQTYDEVKEALSPDNFVVATDDAADLREGDMVYVESAGARVPVGRADFVEGDEVLVTVKADDGTVDDKSFPLADVFAMTKEQRKLETALYAAQFDALEETLAVMTETEALLLFKRSKAEMEDVLEAARRPGAARAQTPEMTFFQKVYRYQSDAARDLARTAQMLEVDEAATLLRDYANKLGLAAAGDVYGDTGAPKYLDEVIQYLRERRAMLKEGTVTARDFVKSWLLTAASQRAQATDADMVKQAFAREGVDINNLKGGINFDEAFVAEGRVRPEEMAAAWLLSPTGQKFLDDYDRGVFNREAFNTLVGVRAKPFGNADVLRNVARDSRPDNVALDDIAGIQRVIEDINAAKGDYAKLNQLLGGVKQISDGKAGFIKHFLGLGDTPTIDARALDFWLRGSLTDEGLSEYGIVDKFRLDPKTGKRVKVSARSQFEGVGPTKTQQSVSSILRDRIRDRMQALQASGVGADLEPDIAAHILHHWIWDAVGETPVTHEGLYKAMRLAQMGEGDDAAAAGARGADEVEEARRLWEEQGVESPYFKRWFGDSKVVDDEGQPLVVYHGTPVSGGINAFDFSKTNQADPDVAFSGFWFTDSPEEANTYALSRAADGRRKGKVESVYLRIKNLATLGDVRRVEAKMRAEAPKDPEGFQRYFTEDGLRGGGDKLSRMLQDEGFDGVLWREANRLSADLALGDEARVSGYRVVREPEGYRAFDQDGDEFELFASVDEVNEVLGQPANYVIFNPEQVKSVVNRGTFDPQDARILFQMDEGADAPRSLRGEQQPLFPGRAAPEAPKPATTADMAEVKAALRDADKNVETATVVKATEEAEVKDAPFRFKGLTLDEVAENEDLLDAMGLSSTVAALFADQDYLKNVDPDALNVRTPVQVFSEEGEALFTGPARIEFIDENKQLVKLRGADRLVPIARLQTLAPRIQRMFIGEKYSGLGEEALEELLVNRGIKTEGLGRGEQIEALINDDLLDRRAKSAAARKEARDALDVFVENSFVPPVPTTKFTNKARSTSSGTAQVVRRYTSPLFKEPVVRVEPVEVEYVRLRDTEPKDVPKTRSKLEAEYRNGAKLLGKQKDEIAEGIRLMRRNEKGRTNLQTAMAERLKLAEELKRALEINKKAYAKSTGADEGLRYRSTIKALENAIKRLETGLKRSFDDTFTSPTIGETQFKTFEVLQDRIAKKLARPTTVKGTKGLKYRDVVDNLKPEIQDVTRRFLAGLEDGSVTADRAGLRIAAGKKMKDETLDAIEGLLVDVGILKAADDDVTVVPRAAEDARAVLLEVFSDLSDETVMAGRLDLSGRVGRLLAEALTEPSTIIDDDVEAFISTLKRISPKEYDDLVEEAMLDSADNLLAEIAYESKRIAALGRARDRAKSPETKAYYRAAIANVEERMETLERLVKTSTPGEELDLLTARARAEGDFLDVEAAPKPTRAQVREAAKAAKKAAKEAQATEVEKMPKGMVRFLQDSTAILYAFKKADVSTGLHEMAHVMRRALSESQLERPLSWVNSQLKARGLEEVSIVEEGGRRQFKTASGQLDSVVEAEELFARAFERFLREGDVPNTVLRRAFATMKELLKRIYTAISGTQIDVEISAEMYDFFDEMFGASKEVSLDELRNVQLFLDTRSAAMSTFDTAVGGRIEEQRFVPRNAMDRIRTTQRSLQDYRARGFGIGKQLVGRFVDKVEGVKSAQEGLTAGAGRMTRMSVGSGTDAPLGPVSRRYMTVEKISELSPGGRPSKFFQFMDNVVVAGGTVMYGVIGSTLTYGGDPMRLLRRLTPEMRMQALGFSREGEEFMSELTMRVLDAARVPVKDRPAALRNLIKYLRGEQTRLLTGAQRGQRARQNFVDTEFALLRHIADRSSKLADDSLELLIADAQKALADMGGEDVVREGYHGALTGFWKKYAVRKVSEKRGVSQDRQLFVSEELEESVGDLRAQDAKVAREKNTADEVSDYFLKNVHKALTGLELSSGQTAVVAPARNLAALMLFHSGVAPMKVSATLKDGSEVSVLLTREDTLFRGFDGLMFGSVLYRVLEDGTVVRRALPGLMEGDTFKKSTVQQRMATLLVMAQSGYVAGVYDDMRKIGFGISGSDYRAYGRYLSGNTDLMTPEEIDRARMVEKRYGRTSFTLAPTLDKNLYIPTATRASLAETLSMGARQAGTEGNRDIGLLRGLYGYVMQNLIFGGVFQRQAFKFMSTVDLGLQLGLVAGGSAGAAAASRASALTLLTALELERVAEVAEGLTTPIRRKLATTVTPAVTVGPPTPPKVVTPAMFKAKLREAVTAKGDEATNAVTNFLGTSKYRAEVAPIMENSDQLYAIGDRIYKASDLRRTFTRAGMYSNAYKDMRAVFSLRHDTPAPNRSRILADADEAEAGLSPENQKFLQSARNTVGDFATSLDASRAGGAVSVVFEHGLESTDAWSDLERTGAAVTLMEMGYSPFDAARIVIDAVYDYRGSMTETDRNWIRRVLMPFFAFRKNALAQATNFFASPEGAFRTIALQKALRFGAEGFTEVMYENILQPYDMNVTAMPVYIRNSYYATRLFLEHGVGDTPNPEELAPFRDQLPPDKADISDEELLDYDFNGWTLRNGYGGYRNVPETARIAMRALIAGRQSAGIRTNGDVKTLSEFIVDNEIRQRYVNEGATMAVRASAGEYGLPAWAARRNTIQVPIPVLDESVKEILSRQQQILLEREGPMAIVGDAVYFVLPDTFIQAAIDHAGALLAGTIVAGGAVFGEELPEGVRFKRFVNAMEPIIDARTPSPIADIGFKFLKQAGSDPYPTKTYISPWAARIIEGSLGTSIPHDGDRKRNPFLYTAGQLLSFGAGMPKTFEDDEGRGIRPRMYSRQVQVVVEDSEGRRETDENFDASTAARKVVPAEETREYTVEGDELAAYKPYLTGRAAITYRYSILGQAEAWLKSRYGDTPLEQAIADSDERGNAIMEALMFAARQIGVKVEVSDPQRAALIDSL